jgi:glycosyltransferase involved in cell wall biosynthesis
MEGAPGQHRDGLVHILYLIDSLIAGGAERSLATLTPHYLTMGIDLDVAILYERDNVWRGPIEEAGANVISLAGSGGRIGAVGRTVQLLRRRKPDLLHTTLFDADFTGRIASIASRVPVVCSLVNEAYGNAQLRDERLSRSKVRVAQFADAVTARRVVRFHAVSTSVAEAMASRLRVPRERIEVIPRGRDPEELGTRTTKRRQAMRKALNVADETLLILAIGRHEYQKGFDVLLHAFATASIDRDAVLMLAGRDGTMTKELRQIANELRIGDAVSFLGFRHDVANLLCAADVFVSASRWEGSPGSVLEAMALETPIVATDIVAVREVLDDLGTLVPVDDVAALATAISTADVDRDAPARARRARARFVERYTAAEIAHEMAGFYRRALA